MDKLKTILPGKKKWDQGIGIRNQGAEMHLTYFYFKNVMAVTAGLDIPSIASA